MALERFIDRRAGKLSNVRRTPQGGFLVDATLAKVGVMEYWTNPNSTPQPTKLVVRRYNPATTLQDACQGVAVAPVTMGHPKEFVDTGNYQKLAAGHVVGMPTFADGHIKATLAIQDAALIRAIELGECREVSMGYYAEHDNTPGVAENGEAYDESRVKIEWNHIAVVPAGRAGKTVRLMLDSAEIPQEPEETMLRIGDKEVAADEAQGALDAFSGLMQGQVANLTTERDAARGELAGLQAQVAELTTKLAAAESDSALDARLEARLAAEKDAAEKATRRASVAKHFPSISLDGQSEDFVNGLFAAIPSEPTGEVDELVNVRTVVPPTTDSKPKPESAEDARRRVEAEQRDEWKRSAE
ncbi:MAG: Rhizobium phage RHEph06 [Pseudomonadota bacterium]|jgi:hypothetical protein